MALASSSFMVWREEWPGAMLAAPEVQGLTTSGKLGLWGLFG
jgi:hypothetical protein